jgi:hypothetical protein
VTDYTPFNGGRVSERPLPRLELVELAWRMRAPSGRILECGIYLTDAGFEVRMGYSINDPLATQYALTLDLARRNAETFREATEANPKFVPFTDR